MKYKLYWKVKSATKSFWVQSNDKDSIVDCFYGIKKYVPNIEYIKIEVNGTISGSVEAVKSLVRTGISLDDIGEY